MEYLQYSYNLNWKINTLEDCFKPCYKWNTFNTGVVGGIAQEFVQGVLNLVISGIPSIHISFKLIWVCLL